MKIIHRYLPLEVGEMVVYYVWLVVPFLEQLHILAPVHGLGDPGSFLWPKSVDAAARLERKTAEPLEDNMPCRGSEQNVVREEPWESDRLGSVIKEEFKRGLNTTASIILWRHTAIAISRRHLPEGNKFKRDYGLDERNTAMDLQAAHTSRMAGICYARDMREGPGQTASLRAEFRALSRSWHTCLGFGVPLPPRDMADLCDGVEAAVSQDSVRYSTCGDKRSREEVEQQLNDWMRGESLLRINNKRRRSATKGNIYQVVC
jgi:hypothetical protein